MLTVLFRALLAMVLFFTAVAAQGQSSSSFAYMPPVISLLLDDQQCPMVTAATTQIGDQTITTQEQLDLLTDTTKIDGSLTFDTTLPSLDFSPLDSLIEITGSLRFADHEFSIIEGFDCLGSVGDRFEIVYNAALEIISGFASLVSTGVAGDIIVSYNPVFDCTDPAPNFSPVNESSNNQVNCELATKTVFVTQQLTNGALGLIDGADDLCQGEADAAGLTGTYLAWLSTSDSSTAPINRFVQSADPYVRPDGVVIADDWADLVDGTLDNRIIVQADGMSAPFSDPVWTNVDGSGNTVFTNSNDACDNWSVGDVSADGRRGFYSGAGVLWTTANDASCGLTARLYCFEQ